MAIDPTLDAGPSGQTSDSGTVEDAGGLDGGEDASTPFDGGVVSDGGNVEDGGSDAGVIVSPEPFKVLVFSKTLGFRHDAIPAAVAALGNLGVDAGFTVDATEDSAAFTSGNLEQYAVVVFALTTGNVLEGAEQSAFEQWLGQGGGYVGIHSASDTGYDWAWYGDLVGARFDGHPAIQSATVHLENASHLSTRGLPDPWQRTDEWYNLMPNPRANVTVLAVVDEASYSGGTMGADHPISWFHAFGGGRSWYTAMGHTASSYDEPEFLAHLRGGLFYAAGR